MPDFYRILEIKPSATPEQVRLVYHGFVRDAGGEESVSHSVRLAAQVLGSPLTRTTYDEMLHAARSGEGPHHFIGQIAPVGRDRPARRVRGDHRSRGSLHDVPKGQVVNMGDVDHHAQPVELADHLSPEPGQSGMPGRQGLVYPG